MAQRHFTATGVVVNKEGRALMIHHRKLGVWLPPGGHVEPDETPDDAVKREVYEETGIVAEIIENGERGEFAAKAAAVLPTPRHIYLEDIGFAGDHFHIDLIYYLRPTGGAEHANRRETDDMRWVDEKELITLDTYDNAKAVVADALRLYGGK